MERNLCVTLVIYHESLHDARSTKYKINSLMLVMISGFFVFLLVIVLNEHTNNVNFLCLQADTSMKQV